MVNHPANILDCWLRLQLQLGPPPVSPLGIVPDSVTSSHPKGKYINSAITNKVSAFLIHWGIGRFCLPFLASFCLILNVLRADIISVRTILKIQWWGLALKSKLRIKAHRYHSFYITKKLLRITERIELQKPLKIYKTINAGKTTKNYIITLIIIYENSLLRKENIPDWEILNHQRILFEILILPLLEDFDFLNFPILLFLIHLSM